MATIIKDETGVYFVSDDGSAKLRWSENQVKLIIDYYEGQLLLFREYQRLLTQRVPDAAYCRHCERQTDHDEYGWCSACGRRR